MSDINGTSGSDNLAGTSRADDISGGSGNDTLSGLSGNDDISGGSGSDVLYGGSGSDELEGGSGNDLLFGGSGNDELEGGSGDDILLGGTGNDELEGGSGDDILLGGSGKDELEGGSGDDILFGGTGNDELEGGRGDDILFGGSGKDELEGGSGNDIFSYLSRLDSSVSAWDRILDFKQCQDKIDLSALLCSENLAWGNQSAIANGAWFLNSGSSTFVFADTNGDSCADLKIELKNTCGLNLNVNDLIGVSDGNNAPMLTVDAIGGVTEDANDAMLSDTGALSFTDADVNDTHTVSSAFSNAVWTDGILSGAQITALTSGFSADSNSWDYTVANSAMQFLGAGESVTLSFNVTVTDNSGAANNFDTEIVMLTLTGVNDAATITGDANGEVTEDGAQPGDSGSLTANDVDTGEAVFQAVAPASLDGNYGDFTFNEMTGAWTYTLANNKPNVQALNDKATVQDSLTVFSFDGTDSETITVNIIGANDAATITGKASGKVTEDGSDPQLDNFGKLNVDDVDTGEAAFQAPVSLAGTYGDFTFDSATGDWTYALTNGAANVQALNDKATVQDSLKVFSLDGTASETITVDITGSNDDATITGGTSGAVVEAGGVDNGTPGTPGASGDLDVNDVDTGEAVFQAVGQANLAGTYGDFTFNEMTGAWTYALDQSKADSLTQNQQVTDQLMVNSFDGTASQTVTVNITGANDAPRPLPDNVEALYDGKGFDFTRDAFGNVLDNDSDPEDDSLILTKVDGSPDNLGTFLEGDFGFINFAIDGTGNWSYYINQNGVDELAANGEFTEVFDYTVAENNAVGAFDSSALSIHITDDAFIL